MAGPLVPRSACVETIVCCKCTREFGVPQSTNVRFACPYCEAPNTLGAASLPAGFVEGDAVFWASADWAPTPGFTITYGARGEVVGAAGSGVEVRFARNDLPGSTAPVGVECFAAQLCRSWPPPRLPGGARVGDGVYFYGASQAPAKGYTLEFGSWGEVAGHSIA
jgi:hypothetical protein